MTSSLPRRKYEKVTRIFVFLVGVLARAGLARYLSHDHSIRALELLSEKYETEDIKTPDGHVPFNFTFVKAVAHLYKSRRIDKNEIDDILKKYGETSSAHLSFFASCSICMRITCPLSDKQWLSQKLRMPIKKIEVQHLKAITARNRSRDTAKQAG